MRGCGEKKRKKRGGVVVARCVKREHSTVTLNSLPRISPGSLTPQPSSMRGGTCPLLPLKMQGKSFFHFFSFLLSLSFYFNLTSFIQRTGNLFSLNVQFTLCGIVYLLRRFRDHRFVISIPSLQRVSRIYRICTCCIYCSRLRYTVNGTVTVVA